MAKKKELKKYCAACDKLMIRKRFKGRLEDMGAFRKRHYCDRACMAAGMLQEEVTDSALLKRVLKHRKPRCEQCGTEANLGIHHIDGNRNHNEPSNLRTLCASCHTTWHWQNGKKASKRQSVCKICGQPARKLDFCQKHYQRFKKYGDPCLTKKKVGSAYVLVREPPGVKNGRRSRES